MTIFNHDFSSGLYQSSSKWLASKSCRGIDRSPAVWQDDLSGPASCGLPSSLCRFSAILYLPVDHFVVVQKAIYDIATDFANGEGELLCLDEVHKNPTWSQDLKSIVDTLSTLRVVASGSSMLQLNKGSHDLNRRVLVQPQTFIQTNSSQILVNMEEKSMLSVRDFQIAVRTVAEKTLRSNHEIHKSPLKKQIKVDIRGKNSCFQHKQK